MSSLTPAKMAISSPFHLILTEVISDYTFFNGTPEERKEKYEDLLERLKTTFSQDDERLVWLWIRIERDNEAWGSASPFETMKSEFPRIHHIVKLHRSMSVRQQGSLETIKKYWGDGARQFEEKKYDFVKYVAQCAPFVTLEWCLTKIPELISARLQDRRKGISKSPEQQNRDWRMLSELIKKERWQVTTSLNIQVGVEPGVQNNVQDVEKAKEERERKEREEEERRKREEEERQEREEKERERREEEEERMRREEEEKTERERREEEQERQEEEEREHQQKEKERERREEEERERREEEERERREEEERERREEEEERERREEEEQVRTEDEERQNEQGPSNKRKRQAMSNKPIKRGKRFECWCAEYPTGPDNDWKKEVERAKYEDYDVKDRMILMGGIAWRGFEACPNHLKKLESFLNLVPERSVYRLKANLKKYWRGRHDIARFMEINSHLFF